jgi:hypothetical protein
MLSVPAVERWRECHFGHVCIGSGYLGQALGYCISKAFGHRRGQHRHALALAKPCRC